MLSHLVVELFAAIRRLPRKWQRCTCRALVLPFVVTLLLVSGLIGWCQLVHAAWCIRLMS